MTPKSHSNLELLRFAAALTVVVHHFRFLRYPSGTDVLEDPGPLPWSGVLHPIYAHGELAVPLFWLLSGFIFFSQYLERIATGDVSAWRFTVLRFSRLYPLHVTTALFVFAVQHVFRTVTPSGSWFIYQSNSAADLALHLVMASQWLPNRPFSLNGPIWSVSLEVLAYASFFVTARRLRRPWVVVACAPGLLLYGAVATAPLAVLFGCFYLGGGAWYLRQAARSASVQARAWAGVAALTVSSALVVSQRAVLMEEIWKSPAQMLTLYAAFLAAIVGLSLIPQMSGRRATLATYAGNLTYGTYLLHFPILLTAMTAANALGTSLPWRSPMLLGGYIVTVGVAALLSFRYLEHPWQHKVREYGSRKQEVAS